jgi:hypothetical protein
MVLSLVSLILAAYFWFQEDIASAALNVGFSALAYAYYNSHRIDELKK